MSRRAGAARGGLVGLKPSVPAPRGALAEAVALLAHRARTSSELREALAGRHAPGELEAALERLRHLGYLDDEVWARRYVESRRGRGRGSWLLRRELLQRGVDAGVVEAVLAGRDELAAACAAARPRLRASDELRAEQPSRRLAGFLVRRGFAPDVVAQAVRELLGKEFETQAGDPGGGSPMDGS